MRGGEKWVEKHAFLNFSNSRRDGMAVAAAAAWLASFSGPSDAEVAWAAELKDTSNALHDLARDLANTDARLLRGDNAARFADSLRRCAAATEVQHLEFTWKQEVVGGVFAVGRASPAAAAAVAVRDALAGVLSQTHCARSSPEEGSTRRQVLSRLRGDLSELAARVAGEQAGHDRRGARNTRQPAPPPPTHARPARARHALLGERSPPPPLSPSPGPACGRQAVGNVVLAQRAELSAQDGQLEALANSVGMLKRTTLAVHSELAAQAALVNGLGADVDATRLSVRRLEQRAAAQAGGKSLLRGTDSSAAPAPQRTWAEETSESCVIS